MKARGFLIFAQGSEHFQQAYLAALSLKASHNKYPVSVVTDCESNAKYDEVFDEVLDIPWQTQDETEFKTQNRWKLYHVTPYSETIVLDSDVLVLQNLEYFWNLLGSYDLFFPTSVFTYRRELVTTDFYRRAFIANNLPNLYNAVHYFRKSDFALEFYKWVETVNNNWQLFYGNFCKEYYPQQPSMDITTAIVAKILNCETSITSSRQSMPELVHMKPRAQHWRQLKTSWQEVVGTYLTPELQLKIGNHVQDTIFHYTENNFVTEDVIRKYEKCLNL